MKHLLWCTFVLLALWLAPSAIAQPGGRGPDRERPGVERLERFKRMRLVESLKLNEEDAVRFVAKQTAHDDKIRELFTSRADAMSKMKELLQGNGNASELQKHIDDVLDLDQKIFAERRRYQEDVRKLLTAEQFAKFLVFEQNFGRQMREALDEMREGRRGRDSD